MPKQFHNSGKLVRFILKRTRFSISIWILAISLITLAVAPTFTQLYPTVQDRMVMAETMKNPAMIAMIGPGYGTDNYTVGAMFGHEMLLFTAVAVAIMNILLVVRHTRKDEERGRLEVIRALPVGRLSNLGSTLIVSLFTNVILALVIGFGLFVLRIDSMDFIGSITYGAALGATGIIFSAIAALFAQLCKSSRGAVGYSFAFLGVAYIARAVGDIGSEMLSLISPLGLILRVEVYVNNYLWPITITLVLATAISILALYLNYIRDLGAGFISAKPGRKTASVFLQGSFGLSFRLLRNTIIAWAVGMFVLGVAYGSVLGDLEAFFENNDMIKKMLPPAKDYTLTEQFLSMLMAVISMISTVPVLQMVLKLRGEEKRNRTDHLLVRAVSRYKLLGGYTVISFIVAFIMQVLSVLGLYLAGSVVMQDPVSFGRLFKSAIVYLPAMWVMISVTVFIIGILPKLTSAVWMYLGYTFFVIYLGGLMDLPEFMSRLSPFGYIPKLPIDNLNYTNLITLTLIAVLLTGVGFIGFKKRDMQG